MSKNGRRLVVLCENNARRPVGRREWKRKRHFVGGKVILKAFRVARRCSVLRAATALLFFSKRRYRNNKRLRVGNRAVFKLYEESFDC